MNVKDRGGTGLCYAEPTTSLPTTISDFYVDLKDDESIVTRIIDQQAGVVIWIVNSKTYGHAVGIAILPIEQTRLPREGKFLSK